MLKDLVLAERPAHALDCHVSTSVQVHKSGAHYISASARRIPSRSECRWDLVALVHKKRVVSINDNYSGFLVYPNSVPEFCARILCPKKRPNVYPFSCPKACPILCPKIVPEQISKESAYFVLGRGFRARPRSPIWGAIQGPFSGTSSGTFAGAFSGTSSGTPFWAGLRLASPLPPPPSRPPPASPFRPRRLAPRSLSSRLPAMVLAPSSSPWLGSCVGRRCCSSSSSSPSLPPLSSV